MTSNPDTEATRPLLVPMGGLDALIQRAYARLTWRLPIATAAMHWIVVMAFHALFVVQIGRLEGVGRHAQLVWLGRIAIGLVLAMCVAMWASLRAARPLATRMAEPSEDAAREALRLAHRLPMRLIGVNFAAGLLFSFPVTVVSTEAAVHVAPGLLQCCCCASRRGRGTGS